MISLCILACQRKLGSQDPLGRRGAVCGTWVSYFFGGEALQRWSEEEDCRPHS
ncbi:Hypothetical predicted protein [Prunus dulcis]|uniref:Uncharacterized protein n=1 Tax=Prunus dulcis TaxID=3755 RepID=A0A5E4FSZ6_PRUDU|nr:Hypothetical predicted protein [Prunus dulcis]